MKNKNQDLDRLINGIRTILTNRCSLPEEDVAVLKECISLLEEEKKDLSPLRLNAASVVRTIEALYQIFRVVRDDDFTNFF
ncbi:MAG TPA: hypothetical protein VF691_13925 [Cytophagaceae bacterium]|jgi:hypothetical protein